MREIIIYHSADFDGIASCLIAWKYVCNYRAQEDIELFGWNYGDELPSAKTMIERYDKIYMVDISFPANIMRELFESGKLVWIDHHQTAISDSDTYAYNTCPGLRRIGTAACELTWEFCFPNYTCPDLIQYLGAWDVFNKTRFDWENIVNPLQMSCSEHFGMNPKNWMGELDAIFSNDQTLLQKLISDGMLIYGYTKKRAESAVRKYAFEVRVAGRLRGICILNTTFGSMQFVSVIKNYDCCVVANRRDANTYNFSIYIEPEKEGIVNFSAGEYMKANYNGGGHKNAAGGILNLDQFLRLITEQEV